MARPWMEERRRTWEGNVQLFIFPYGTAELFLDVANAAKPLSASIHECIDVQLWAGFTDKRAGLSTLC